MTRSDAPDFRKDVLLHGELEVRGRLVDASNATLFAVATLDGVEVECVYKPSAGERPLWDFPNADLAARETATAELAAFLGWSLVPPTVLRADGPYGAGMVQAWVDVDDDADVVDVVAPNAVPAGWLQVLAAEDGEGNPVVLVHADRPELQRLAVLDAIANNGDRKGGHVLVATDGAVFGIDHGVSWHVEDKLRTVLWGWANTPLPSDIADDLQRFAANWDEFAATLATLLPPDDVVVARERLDRLIESSTFPLPSPDWPAIPWPVF